MADLIEKKRSGDELSREGASSDGCTSLLIPVASEAIAAFNRSVGGWLERNLTGLPALCANRIVHLTGCIVTVAAIAGTAIGVTLTSNPAGLAALRFIRKAFFGEKFLLVGSKGEFLSAIFADDGLVAVHLIPH
ncbi:MAG TPA: hypothetical protein VN417_04660 [Candidatus Cryosericum sp.]|nr:hypothetical protein [Candidatus Cryosericum sp.]